VIRVIDLDVLAQLLVAVLTIALTAMATLLVLEEDLDER